MNPTNPSTTPRKVAVVTGASSGIGHEAVGLLLKHGLKVYGLSRTKPDFVNEAFVWLECDLMSEDSIKAAAQKIVEPQLELLVCNAGTAIEESATIVTQRSFDNTFKLNVLAPMLLVRELHGKLYGAPSGPTYISGPPN